MPSKSKAILHDIERCMAKIMFDNFGSLKFSMMNTNMRTSLSQSALQLSGWVKIKQQQQQQQK